MAASQTSDDVPARLEAVRQSLHTVAGTVLFIGSTVMSPDTPREEVAQDAALERYESEGDCWNYKTDFILPE